jgi:hypothetical protein
LLATPVARRRWSATGELIDTHGDYPPALRAVATEEAVPLLELNRLTADLERAHGVEGSKRLHLHFGSWRAAPLAGRSEGRHALFRVWSLTRGGLGRAGTPAAAAPAWDVGAVNRVRGGAVRMGVRHAGNGVATARPGHGGRRRDRGSRPASASHLQQGTRRVLERRGSVAKRDAVTHLQGSLLEGAAPSAPWGRALRSRCGSSFTLALET